MAKAQNRKKAASKGKKSKKGSPAKRSFFFQSATIILALLTTLLLLLGILYLARVQHWLASPLFSNDGKRSSVSETLKKRPPAQTLKAPLHAEEYHEVVSPRREHHEPLIREEGPRLAIIVDDLGTDLAMMREFLDIKLNLTVAVLPNVPHARESAELAHAAGHEVLLHIPMEPKNYPTVDPGVKALMVDLPVEQVQQRMRDYLHTVPWVVGANNHMGSRFTENHQGMRAVLQVLKDQGSFFIDSRTTANSIASTEADTMKVANAERDLFLDNELSEEEIRRQIQRLIKIAKVQGSAIGICHPHAETYAALKKETSTFAASGVKLVKVSALLH